MNYLEKHALNIPEEEYHQYSAWSYSTIAKYSKEGFGALKTLHERTAPTASMEFGSLFDSMITRGKKTLDEYAVVNVPVPDAEKKALDYIWSRTNDPHLKLNEISPDDLTRYCDECQYQTRWGYDARLKHLTTYSNYYDIIRTGKKPVSELDWKDATEMYNIFRNDSYLKELFGTGSTKDTEYLYQLQFVIDYTLPSGRTVPIKIMIDLTKIDHKAKTIQLVDLKTSSMPAYNFKENFLKFQYFLQASIYATIFNIIKNRIPELQDYEILPYLFTDISRSDKVPVTYSYDPFAYDQVDGFSFESNGKQYKYKSWQTLLDEIISYEESQAKVPSEIFTDKPNDLLKLLSK